ncbi:hypothetical protein PR202_gb26119 [Eleusine coracana subsp. coracana]|uniref:Uncharacterized protein n=1 Tax=Eleusine coracana subsp. coracana TaxID=191504 RepID=A0AAV5FR13_ELECO|nr:hypothetical protein PR202_gb26119 [Eleusine coracana subsp. coracana]
MPPRPWALPGRRRLSLRMSVARWRAAQLRAAQLWAARWRAVRGRPRGGGRNDRSLPPSPSAHNRSCPPSTISSPPAAPRPDLLRRVTSERQATGERPAGVRRPADLGERRAGQLWIWASDQQAAKGGGEGLRHGAHTGRCHGQGHLLRCCHLPLCRAPDVVLCLQLRLLQTCLCSASSRPARLRAPPRAGPRQQGTPRAPPAALQRIWRERKRELAVCLPNCLFSVGVTDRAHMHMLLFIQGEEDFASPLQNALSCWSQF